MRASRAAILASLAASLGLGGLISACEANRTIEEENRALPDLSREPQLPILRSVEGQVQRSRGDKPWTQAQAGDRLHEEERIRTSKGGRATVGLGDETTVLLGAESEIGVLPAKNGTRRLALKSGRVAVKHRGASGQRVRVESDRGQVIETQDGDFAARVGKNGFSIAMERGTADFTSAGTTVKVAENEQTFAAPDLVPSPAAPIPTEVLLEVGRIVTLRDRCRVSGTAPRGAEVSVDGQSIEVDSDGQFFTTIARRTHPAEIAVTTVDTLGRVASKKLSCPIILNSKRKPKIRELSIEWGK